MGRGKLKLELIKNEKSRKTTFQKRKKGMMKKASEFSILCDIDMCLFVSGPKSDLDLAKTRPGQKKSHDHEVVAAASEIETFPPESDRVLRIIQKYQKAVMQRPPNKSYNLAGLLAERNKKVHSDISRFRKKFYGLKYPTSAELIDGLSADELEELVGRLDGKIDVVKKIIVEKGKENALRLVVNNNSHDDHQQQQLVSLSNNHNFSTNYSIVDMSERPPPPQIDSSFSVFNPNFMMIKLLGDDNNQASTSTSRFDDRHDQFKYYFNVSSSNTTNNMHYGTDMTTLRGPVYDDHATAGMMFDGTSTTASTQYSTVTTALRSSHDPTAGMSLEKHTMMFNGSGAAGTASSSMQSHGYYYRPPLVPPMMVPMQYPMNVMNVVPRLGSFHVASPAPRVNELTDVVNDFLKNKNIG
ncbi:MADS-box transcription factor [Trema orientale]|uniref:MADS-box transcription factor n=1 Tax=Trema orientale TaxID=63057 RepID=A0A2P5BKD2_TREOI|nr:MADS-box transcription factor [Trema orientale]